MGVYLSPENTLQPDLMFITQERRGIIGERKIEGAPDLIMEIPSPSTAYLDLTKKKRLYEQHGVKEYWIIDPDQRTVEIFENTDSGFMQHARLVESGTTASTLPDGFSINLNDLFQP